MSQLWNSQLLWLGVPQSTEENKMNRECWTPDSGIVSWHGWVGRQCQHRGNAVAPHVGVHITILVHCPATLGNAMGRLLRGSVPHLGHLAVAGEGGGAPSWGLWGWRCLLLVPTALQQTGGSYLSHSRVSIWGVGGWPTGRREFSPPPP